MKRSSPMDFTPLIDVFLILLFAILLNTNTADANQFEAENQQLLSENTTLTVQLEKLESQLGKPMLTAIEDYSKLTFVQDRLLMLDVTIRTPHNQIWIDENPTPIVLKRDSAPSLEERLALIESIQTTLLQTIETSTKDTSVIVLSVGEDGNAYRYAYLLLEEALMTLKDKTKGTFYFRTMETLP